jgi:protein involved in polysaccharide export with SLBB domain
MRRIIIAIAAVLLGTQPLAAQFPEDWDPGRVYMTRAELVKLLNRLENTAGSPAFGDALRREARQQVRAIADRLEAGDFQIGDRVVLRVQSEPALTDTFAVSPDRSLELPTIGTVPLAGVLRAELQPHLDAHIRRFLRDPQVQARSLLRVTLEGGVLRPGFYTVASEQLLTDVLMAAGGPTPTARMDKIEVQRGETPIWEPDPLQKAMAEGRTLDQLSMRAGDRVLIPQKKGLGGAETTVRTLSLILSIPLSIFALTQIF